MNHFLPRLLRNLCLAAIALIGAAMAIIFMVSTAIAIGLLYIVARLRGKPFGVRGYWQQRRGPMHPFNAPGQPYAKAATDVIDVQAREIR
ncbi:hypothetical protein [Bordetella sp. FB-8]|uniref:hypothetical protein n=1 Tax=Bordetella sp. FB-8 TaxID=1159870 RepID=UPI0003744213|nr:hypothetical protein [Bordetella sp. FB-8]